MTHTAEPWEFKNRSLYKQGSTSNEIAFFGDEPEDVLNGERAAKCVNALSGLSDDALNGGWKFKEISAIAAKNEKKIELAEYIIGAFERGADADEYAADIAEFRMS